MEFRILVGDSDEETGSAQGDTTVWRITQAALDWYTSKLKDGGVEACRICPARLALFAAIEQARAAHLTHVAAPVPC